MTPLRQNRDRLEVYAFHKQAVSGDAPTRDQNPNATGVNNTQAERAKLGAWMAKRGMTQSEAMLAYVSECDRQIRVYGTAGEDSNVGGAGGSSSPSSRTPEPGGTPTNTPRTDNSGGSSPLFTPRGVAAIPLLCAAAAETRSAYLSRLRATGPPLNGWWAKQEPLCADPGTALALPERGVIAAAAAVEHASLVVGSDWSNSMPAGISPKVVQAYLWPAHNVLLVCWIMLVFISTLVSSAFVIIKTVLLGARRTGALLPCIFSEEIKPTSRAASGLCEPHQAVTVRLAGLVLSPLRALCDASDAAADTGGVLLGSMVFVGGAVLSSWYWCFVLPWLGLLGMWTAICVGWCFALIEFAGV